MIPCPFCETAAPCPICRGTKEIPATTLDIFKPPEQSGPMRLYMVRQACEPTCRIGVTAMLIVAPVATWARRLASQDAGVEGGQLWLDHRRTVAVLLGEAVPGTEPGILMKEHARD